MCFFIMGCSSSCVSLSAGANYLSIRVIEQHIIYNRAAYNRVIGQHIGQESAEDSSPRGIAGREEGGEVQLGAIMVGTETAIPAFTG